MRNDIITEEIKSIEKSINDIWRNRFKTEKEQSLSKIFSKPENPGLQHIWRYGSADLCVFRNNKLVCIIEAGGSHHFEEKQSLNDRRKWKLCDINNVPCLTMMNGLQQRLSKRKWRALLGRYLFRGNL